jgi:hypothetical protein
MMDWLTDRQKADAIRKAKEAEIVASFIASGKMQDLGYSDENKMKRIQRNWNRDVSPAEMSRKEEEEKYCIFSKAERR